MYLCYDIKGIQRFIFSVPKLKCIIGGSSLIAEMDQWAATKNTSNQTETIFAGGGRGAFFCINESVAQRLKKDLREKAHESGLDIRFGLAGTLAEAVRGAEELYPYCPDDLSGAPCEVSGLWPVGSTPARFHEKTSVHPMIKLRLDKARKDTLGEKILKELLEKKLLPSELLQYELEFFSNVNPRSEELQDEEELELARCGYNALGRRNRWAIVAMDGNDMGRQFSAFDRLQKERNLSEQDHRAWLGSMSGQLKDCTWQAFIQALGVVITNWVAQRTKAGDVQDCIVHDSSGKRTNRLVLPFRPLVLGGDDVTMLCHGEHAMTFVRELSRRFSDLSKATAVSPDWNLAAPLWPATNGRLTISAGVLFVKTSFPLSSAIPYAESLLASAKGKFRQSDDSNSPATPAVDWDTITDTLLDTPAARRRRELRFIDEDLSMTIDLTQRPHPIHSIAAEDSTGLDSLDRLCSLLTELPNSLQAELARVLTKPYSERTQFMASIAKRHSKVKDLLWEASSMLGDGWIDSPDKKQRSTGVLDALSLMDEQRRFSKPIDIDG